MAIEALEKIIEELKGIPKERDRLQELTKRIYDTIPKMFEKVFTPAGIEIHPEHGTVSMKIYAWHFAKSIAEELLGYEIEKARGDSWSDAQRRAGYTK